MGLNLERENDLKFLRLEMELKREDITPEELIEMYKPLAEDEKKYKSIAESTRAERIKRYGDIDKDWEGELDESFIDLMKLMNKESHYGGKAVDINIECEEIAYKYKKLTGRDIKEDL